MLSQFLIGASVLRVSQKNTYTDDFSILSASAGTVFCESMTCRINKKSGLVFNWAALLA